jgi:D-alanyl-lipoteichoic acid acyltransferase DltB (MBOAT superfamily)
MFLLATSYTFYATAGLECLVYISITTLSTYVAAYMIGRMSKIKAEYIKANRDKLDKNAKKNYKENVKKKQRLWLVLALIVDLGLLLVLKYTNFLIDNINGVVTSVGSFAPISYIDIIMPLGISFYTFQSVGYLIDVYNEKYAPEAKWLLERFFI